ncbi:unnamed protein product [Rotaria sp. Silwood1]|nr:unnamed protein product [Rotaria sp. Silwood1]CAF4614726.1 unnamed protein product [Rotaria sp. Silwood1]
MQLGLVSLLSIISLFLIITKNQAEKTPVTKRDPHEEALMNLFVKRLNSFVEEAESEGKRHEDRDARSKDIRNSPDVKPSSQNAACSLYWDYSMDTNNVYFLGKKVKDANPSTFQLLDEGYAKDEHNVYYMGEKIESAFRNSFQLLDKGYAKDSFYVYHMGNEIKNADTDSFKSLGYGYAKDINSVFYMGEKLEDAHPSSFQFIDAGYANDYSNAYCVGKE